MRILATILFFFSAGLSFAQDPTFIAKQDTIYIILPQSEQPISTEYPDFKLIISGNGAIYEENFYMKDNHHIFIYTQKKHKENKVVKRESFFKNNKDQIIDLKFIETHSPKKVFVDMFRFKERRTVVYVIDENQLKKRKITLKKAFVYTEDYMEM
ncbi:MAG: hypothetical protein ACO1N9_01540 [Flavobacterium sp.]